MTPDELLTHLETELARCRDERDRLRAELEAARIERDQALQDGARWDRMLLALQVKLDEAEHERDWLYGELQSVIGSKSWMLTRPLRGLRGSDRPETAERQ
jgi:uncharacterized protein (DUF3084 family)